MAKQSPTEHITKSTWYKATKAGLIPFNTLASFKNPHPTPLEEYALGIRMIEHELKVFLQGDLRKHLHGDMVRDEERKRPSFKPSPL